MTIKIITPNLQFVCETFSNSRSWGHKGTAIYNGREVASCKIVYQNRTWERYQFETLLFSLVDKLDNTKIVPLAERILAYKTIKA